MDNTLKEQHFTLLHNIGKKLNSNYNTLEEVLTCENPTFDGIYLNVYENWDKIKHLKPILFVMGDYIGKDNSFDKGMPREMYCTKEQLDEMGNFGWHTWSHPDLTTLSREEVIKEITPPDWIERTYFAYPYGRYNDLVKECVKEVGFKYAFSVKKTDGDNLTIPRWYR
jgi:hypothetical protein